MYQNFVYIHRQPTLKSSVPSVHSHQYIRRYAYFNKQVILCLVFLLSLLKVSFYFFCCSITVVSISTPLLSPTLPTPTLHILFSSSLPVVFVYGPFIHIPWRPFPLKTMWNIPKDDLTVLALISACVTEKGVNSSVINSLYECKCNH